MKEKYNINRTTLLLVGQYLNNYQKVMHVRELARAIDVDVKTVGLQLRRLEAINVLLSSSRGRNIEYKLNLNNRTAKYYLIMAEIFRSVAFFEEKFSIKKIMTSTEKFHGSLILFGSFAKNRETKESDVDILVLIEIGFDKKALTRVGKEIGKEINVKVVTTNAFARGLRGGDPLFVEIAGNHIVLEGVENFCGVLWDYYGGK